MNDEWSDLYKAIYSDDDTRYAGQSHAWIQWKGTSVCADVHCVCGTHGHVDVDFFYFYRCPSCKQLYAVGQNVALIQLTPDQVTYMETHSAACIHTDDSEGDA